MFSGSAARFVLYSPHRNGCVQKLNKILKGPFSTSQWETINTPQDLKGCLEKQKGELCAVVLVAPSKDVLDRILSLEPLLHGLAVIMILPDSDKETMAQAHKLRPRFYTYIDNGFEEIPKVLQRVLEKHCSASVSMRSEESQ